MMWVFLCWEVDMMLIWYRGFVLGFDNGIGYMTFLEYGA